MDCGHGVALLARPFFFLFLTSPSLSFRILLLSLSPVFLVLVRVDSDGMDRLRSITVYDKETMTTMSLCLPLLIYHHD